MIQVSKIALLAVGVCTLLAGCAAQEDAAWRKDCKANYSYDSRENSVCKERIEVGKQEINAGSQAAVTTDSLDASRPIEGGRESEKSRHN